MPTPKKNKKTSISLEPKTYSEAGRRAKTRYGIGIAALIRALLNAFTLGMLDHLFEENPQLLQNEKKHAPGAGRPPKEGQPPKEKP